MAAKHYELNDDRFVGLLEKLINESKYVQNSPPKFIPEESRIVDHVLKILHPFLVENGGVIKAERLENAKNRSNLILEYTAPTARADKTVAFVGSHMDVVPADPSLWTFDPFTFSRDGDKLKGRGTTDCLGHVAMLTDMFCQFAEKKPELTISVFAVFIASEEDTSIPDIGVEWLAKIGKLDRLKNGPLFWVDSADSQPCIGTAGSIPWTLEAKGRLFHSGLPHLGINSIELASEALAIIQKRFYEDFPALEQEKEYKFKTPSTLKPTQLNVAPGGLNQIPPWTKIQGDVRLTPFYDVDECKKKIEGYVKDINDNINSLPKRGPVSNYEITENGNTHRGSVEITWDHHCRGIACKLDSPGLTALIEATTQHLGEAKPYSIGGSLPLVDDLQKQGFDVQVCGYGHSNVYHGNDEYCSLSHMQNGFRILSQVVLSLSAKV